MSHPLGCRILAIVACTLLPVAGCVPGNPPVSPVAEQSPDFRDVAAESGLDFSWKRGSDRVWTIREGIGTGCAFLDFDRDGWMDILLVGHRRCGLFRNLGGGKFTDVSRAVGITRDGSWTGVAVGDYNSDGYPDLYISGFHSLMLLRNERGRAFSDQTQASGLTEREWGTSSAFFDFDGDGDLDLLVGHYVVTGKGQPEYCPGKSDIPTGCPPMVYPPQFPRLYRNDGEDRFSDATLESGLGMAHGKALAHQMTDYDNDGKTDFYIANDGEPGDLFHNLGGGRFENVGMQTGTAFGMSGDAQAGMGVDFADFDHNGLLDLMVTNFRDETTSLYRNLGRTFEGAATASGLDSTRAFLGFGTKFIDYDDDTWPDVVFANGHVFNNVEANDAGVTLRQPTLLYQNRKGVFNRISEGGAGLNLKIVGRGLAVGDVLNDGSQDVLIVDCDGQPVLLRNHRRTRNHWLGVELRGVAGNRDGYGARVTIKWAGGESFRDHFPSGSYLSSMDPRLHFGLADWNRPVEIQVRWPSGAIATFSHVPVDRYIRISEGATNFEERRPPEVPRK